MDNNQYRIVAIQNIDDEDFVFEYDKSKGNFPYVIPAGQVKRFPGFLAEHALKHLIDKILTKRKERINNDVLRTEIASQIVINEESFQSQPTKTEAEMLKERVEELNKPSELDAILAKRKSQEQPVNPVTEVTQSTSQTTPPTEEFAGLKEGKDEHFVGPEVDTTDRPVPPPPTPEVKPVPTRSEIYAYAVKQGLAMTDDFKKKLDNMNVSELLVEVGNPYDDLTK